MKKDEEMEVNCAGDFALVTDQQDSPPTSGATYEVKAQTSSLEESVDAHMNDYK